MPILCRYTRSCFVALALWTMSLNSGFAQVVDRATSQTVYVPSYSRVLTQEGRSQPLASTLVVHNIDPEEVIEITSIDYYDRTGQMLEAFLDAPVFLAPYESTNALVPLGSVGDGIGANFIVVWSSRAPARPPAIEAIMIGGSGTQGISFTSTGRLISRIP